MSVRRTVALVVALVLVVLAAPAHAESYRHRDAKRDVAEAHGIGCNGCGAFPAPGNRMDDLVGFRVDFDRTGLRLTVTTRKTGRDAPVPELTWTVHTSTDRYLSFIVEVRNSGRLLLTGSTDELGCEDSVARFDRSARRWDLLLGPDCVADARWVEVGARSSGSHDGENYQDDALDDDRYCCTSPTSSPKVRRG